MKILIVEDQELVAMIWERALRPLSVRVILAATMEEALRAMHEIPPPDLVFLDLHLPDSQTAESTLASIQTIKGLNPEVVIVVVTGLLTGEKIVELATAMGADEFRFKQQMESQAALWRVVKTALENRRGKPGGLVGEGIDLIEKITRLLVDAA